MEALGRVECRHVAPDELLGDDLRRHRAKMEVTRAQAGRPGGNVTDWALVVPCASQNGGLILAALPWPLPPRLQMRYSQLRLT